MAKTYDAIPYEHQVLGNLLTHVATSNDKRTWNRLLERTANRVKPDWRYSDRGVVFALAGMEDDFIIELTEAEAELTGEPLDTSFNLVSYACRSGTFDTLKACDISHNISTILRTIPRSDVILTDETARFILLYAFLTNSVGVKEVHKIDSPAIRSALYEILNQQLAGSKLSVRTLLETLPKITLPSSNNDLAQLAHLADAAKLLLTSAPADYRNMFRTNNPHQARQWASINIQAGSSRAFSNMEIYRLLSIWYCRVRIHGEVYSLFVDRTTLEQLRQCVRFFAGLQFYCWNYRITGRTNRSYDRRTTFNVLLRWVVEAIWFCYENKIIMGSIAKHCKTSIGAITTLLFDDKDIAEFGATERYQALYNEAADILPGYEHIIDVLTEKCLLYEDEYLDFAYVFHGLPTVDFSPKHLLEKTAKNMNLPINHVYSSEALEDFMRYAKAFHVSHIAYVTKGQVKVRCVEGYTHNDKNWFQKCSTGSYMMPPKDEWGKCWVEDHYEYKELIEYWYLDASDTTHVNRDIKAELKIQARTYIERLEANELTYLFIHGDKLSRNIEPSNVRAWMGTSRLPPYCLSMLSAKAENTKYGDKMRDIHAADDISRECMTEVDRNTNRIASDIAGPVLRMPAPVLNRLLMNTAAKLLSGGHHFATSQDVSQWSVNMPRALMFQFSEYLINMCRGKDKLRLRDIWKNLTLAINRRGYASSKRVDDGCVMGWTGCNDTILHATLASYCIYKAKEAEIIHPDESGESFELIDDSVLAMKLSEKVIYATERISKFLDIMIHTYQSLGFEIDKTKTIVSSCKMTFLNRVFSRGAEVLTPAKVAAKVDREVTRRFSSILEQVQSIFTSGSSAIGRGADPVVYYIYCVHKALTYFSRIIQIEKYSPSDIAFVARAPQAIGGWGIPGIIAMLTTGRSDNLSTFIYEEFETIKILMNKDYSVAVYHNARLRSILERGFLKPSALTFIQNPTGLCLVGPTNPAQRAKREFRRAAFRAARSTFVRTLLSETNEETLEKAIDCLLKSGAHDAAFLEAINDALPSEFVAKSFGGQKLKDKYPWVVTLRSSGGLCTGSLISPRHVLTAAHCVLQNAFVSNPTEEECARRDYRPETAILCMVGSGDCAFPQECPSRWFEAVNIYYNEQFERCSGENDIAVIELSENVPETEATPICLPETEQVVNDNLKAIGGGNTGPNKDYIPHEPDGQQLVDVKLRETRDTLIVVETPPTVGICNGDSGGPLFQTNIENKNVQMGVMSGGLSCEEHYINSLTDNYVEDGVEDNFTDVRQYLDWICENTGVCSRN